MELLRTRDVMQQAALVVAKRIQEKGLSISPDVWQPLYHGVLNALSLMEAPVGHGTSLSFLPSILTKGLGGYWPACAFDPGTNWLFDLHFPDGLIGCQAFAMQDLSHSSLLINANAFLECDMVDRFAWRNPRVASWWKKFFLRRFALNYLKKRGYVDGGPMILIYGEDIQTWRRKVPYITSVVATDEVLRASKLQMLLVPALNVQHTLPMLRSDSGTLVLPIELLELVEIAWYDHDSHRQ